MKFIHLTDPHLTASGSLFEIDIDARLQAAVTSINAHHGDAELAVITGDIAHWGEPGAYQRAATALAELTMPWYPLMGNHDVLGAFYDGFPATPQAPDGCAYYKVDTSAGMFLMLDTTSEGTHGGLLDDAQQAWLEDALVAATGDAFIFMHHPPLDCGLEGLDNIRLMNADVLADVFARNPGKVRHMFFGHMHRPFHGAWRGVPFSSVKSTAHQTAPIFGAGVKLRSSSEMPGYAVAMITAESVAIHDISFLEEHTTFENAREFGGRDKPSV